ncbi:MAG TPA: hypothetical protein DCP71_16725 [Verrucomicrobiales bacterium]|nr:hypothetical protein [Verrucomicrobiales bacterium]
MEKVVGCKGTLTRPKERDLPSPVVLGRGWVSVMGWGLFYRIDKMDKINRKCGKVISAGLFGLWVCSL